MPRDLKLLDDPGVVPWTEMDMNYIVSTIDQEMNRADECNCQCIPLVHVTRSAGGGPVIRTKHINACPAKRVLSAQWN